jgi:hypothetical protein
MKQLEFPHPEGDREFDHQKARLETVVTRILDNLTKPEIHLFLDCIDGFETADSIWDSQKQFIKDKAQINNLVMLDLQSSLYDLAAYDALMGLMLPKVHQDSVSESLFLELYDATVPSWIGGKVDLTNIDLTAFSNQVNHDPLTLVRTLVNPNAKKPEVTLYSLLRAIYARDPDKLKKSHTPESYLDPTNTPLSADEYILMAHVLTQNSLPLDKKGLSKHILMFALLVDNNISALPNQQPIVIKNGLSFTEKKAEQAKYLRMLSYVNQFWQDTFYSLEDPDNPKHDTAKKFLQTFQSDDTSAINETFIGSMFMESYKNQVLLASYIHSLLTNADDMEDVWYSEMANLLIEANQAHGNSPLTIKDIQNRLTQNSAETHIPLSVLSAQIITSHQACMELADEEGIYTTKLNSNELQKFPDLESIWIIGADDLPDISHVTIKIKFKKTQIAYPQAYIHVFNTRDFVECIPVAIDFSYKDLTDQFRSVVYRLVIGAQQKIIQSHIQPIELPPSPPQAKDHPKPVDNSSVPIYVAKGPARTPPKETKRKAKPLKTKVNTIKPSHLDSTYDFFENNIRRYPLKGIHKDNEIALRAKKRYEDNCGRSKFIVEILGPSGGKIMELRAGKYRILFEIRADQSAYYLDTILRKDLDTWLSKLH